MRDLIRDHPTTALLIDDITRLRLHCEDDQDTLDLIRELMDLNVTLILTGVDIPGSGLLRGAYVDQRTGQWVFPDTGRARLAAEGVGHGRGRIGRAGLGEPDRVVPVRRVRAAAESTP
ncbi:hypothetical protein ACWGH7_15460 [Streptomyces cyaneofuscatus]